MRPSRQNAQLQVTPVVAIEVFLVFDLFLNIDLPQLDTDAEESAGGVCRRMPPIAKFSPRPAVYGVPPPRFFRCAQLRRPLDKRYSVNDHQTRSPTPLVTFKSSSGLYYTSFQYSIIQSGTFLLRRQIN